MPQIQPGTILADRYRLESILGRGGMGAVWRAHHLTLNVPLAVKFIDPELAHGADMMARFTREAQAAAALQGCPNVVQTIDHGVHDGIAFIAMELMQGEDLGTRLHRLGNLSPGATSRILSQTGRAITRAHAAGIIHRDLKPDNIFLAQDGDDEIAKVLDFGIAKLLDDSSVSGQRTRSGAVLGTPFYMSPEQAEGSLQLDHRTDIWALGVIACECLTGKHAFNGETLTDLVLAICTRPMPVPSTLGPVPPGFDAWFARSCARDSKARYPSVRTQLRELSEICGIPHLDSEREGDIVRPSAPTQSDSAYRNQRATTAPVVTPGYHPETMPSTGSRRTLFAVGFVFLLSGVGGFAFLSARGREPSDTQDAPPLPSVTATLRDLQPVTSAGTPAGSLPTEPAPTTANVSSADETFAAEPGKASSSSGATPASKGPRPPRPNKPTPSPTPKPNSEGQTQPRPATPRPDEADYGF